MRHFRSHNMSNTHTMPWPPVAAAIGLLTALASTACYANEQMTVQNGNLRVEFQSNAESPRVLSGLQSLFNTVDAKGADAFDPLGSSTSAGLNFEHIISGHANPNNRFTPRHGAYTLHRIDKHTVELRRKREDSPWGVSSRLRYKVVAPHYVDFEFQCVPQDASKFGERGYAIFFWANYMNEVQDVALNFLGKTGPDATEDWITADASQPHRDHVAGGTYRHVGAEDLPYDDDHDFKLNSWSYEWPRFTKPFYFGRAAQGMTLMLMFDRGHSVDDEIRFSVFKFKVNEEHKKPAWDFQYVIHQVEEGREYGFRGRLVWKKFVSPEDCQEEYNAWADGLAR